MRAFLNCLTLFMSITACAGEPAAFVVEISKPLQGGGGGLGTTGYAPLEKEKPLAQKAHQQAEAEHVDIMTEKIAGRTGQFVGWFGIIRSITEDRAKKETRLILEHKYFDNLTDLHLHIVSYFGAGDFEAVLPGTGHPILKLGLLRVYGIIEDNAGKPLVRTQYARYWEWGLFTFMDYGTDATNPEWVKLRKINPDDSYSPRPNQQFYEDRLGKRGGQ